MAASEEPRESTSSLDKEARLEALEKGAPEEDKVHEAVKCMTAVPFIWVSASSLPVTGLAAC